LTDPSVLPAGIKDSTTGDWHITDVNSNVEEGAQLHQDAICGTNVMGVMTWLQGIEAETVHGQVTICALCIRESRRRIAVYSLLELLDEQIVVEVQTLAITY
jgi:hypothetical protein